MDLRPRLVSVTPILDTSIYASGDLVADPVEMTGFFRDKNRAAKIESLFVLDEDAQGVALDIYLVKASTTFGTLNSAPNISDANLRNVVARISLATTDYTTVSGSKIAQKAALGIVIGGPADSVSLWAAIVNGTGTPTFTASGLKLAFGVVD